VILLHDEEAAETYILECDAVWFGIGISPVCRKQKPPLPPASGKNKMAIPLNMTKNIFPPHFGKFEPDHTVLHSDRQYLIENCI
jgi:hypothetical protein